MIRKSIPLVCAAALSLGACGGEPNLPEATGKSNIRAINAIPMSPEVNFLIEERLIGTTVYQNATGIAEYDDLNYTFNFEVFFAGETSTRRFASQNIDIEPSKMYDFLVGGSLQNPSITIWQSDLRTFDETDTVFAVKFAHASASFGELDYYFADPAVAPAIGNQVATLSFGEMSESTDLTEGDFVLTITTAGNPNDVVYTSDTVTYNARNVFALTTFDGDESDTAPVFVRGLSDLGSTFALADINFSPTAQFVNASIGLGTSDIYSDESLTSLLVADHEFLGVSAELDVAVGENPFFYTPAGDTSVVSLESTLSADGGLRYRIVASGPAGNVGSISFNPDLRPVTTHAKIATFHASRNFQFLDLYAVEVDAGIDDAAPFRTGLASGIPTSAGAAPPGSYDLYVTQSGEKTVLAGPYRITVSRGDIVDLIIVDTVDPAVLDLLFLSGGPIP